MKRFQVSGEHKYYSENRPESNEIFYELKDWILDDLLFNEELKEIRFGFYWHYCKMSKPIKVFWRNCPKRMNQKKIVFLNNGFEMEAEHTDWDSIEFERNQILIEGEHGYGIYFVFKKPIFKKYKNLIKLIKKEIDNEERDRCKKREEKKE